ncbi:hypothetical protein [Leptolyngbya sp. 'hensonii']|uniref:hypothetical protein n=1 Tax=Leptolyngbya sp. 'hensonii' TaxID=1922337 RepID=UPI000A9BDA69|nr:hypothetical protein [Leptolyngbya sp. 'hensonii']
MKREVVRDFLNLPGIAGVALMDGRSRPYFCGVDQTLNFQQKEALVQGITQVVETTPDDFESFEFQFTGHQVYIYKLDQGMVLLVLARSELVYPDYVDAIERLKADLGEDVTKAVSTFRLIASDLTMSNQNYWKNRMGNSPDLHLDARNGMPSVEAISERSTPSPANGTRQAPADPRPALDAMEIVQAVPPPVTQIDQSSTTDLPLPKAPAKNLLPNSLERHNPELPDPPSPVEHGLELQIELKEMLAALNALSQFTTQYLGTAVITNYWKSSRPRDDWLQSFQIDRAAKISFADPSSSANLNPQQHQAVRGWVAAFIKRCSQVIRDFPTIVDQGALSDRQKLLLL